MTYTIIVFITLLLMFSSIKKKRQAAKYVYKEQEEDLDMPISPICDIEEGRCEVENLNLESVTFEQSFVDTENENLEEISAKNAPYFTYEAQAIDDVDDVEKQEKTPQVMKENKLQNSENEEESTFVDLKSPEELKKAFIYNEILQNPYI